MRPKIRKEIVQPAVSSRSPDQFLPLNRLLTPATQTFSMRIASPWQSEAKVGSSYEKVSSFSAVAD